MSSETPWDKKSRVNIPELKCPECSGPVKKWMRQRCPKCGGNMRIEGKGVMRD